MTTLHSFAKSFTTLDRRFFLVWFCDIMFYVAVGVISYASYFRITGISARLNELQHMPLTDQLVTELYSLFYQYFAALFIVCLLIFIAYVILQAVQWSTLLEQKIDARFIARFALYLIPALFLVIIPVVLLLAVVFAIFTVTMQLTGILAVIVGAVLVWFAYAFSMPASVFPSYVFFKERKVWPAIARMFYLGFSTVPELAAPYALVTQLYWPFTGVDQTLGLFILMALIVSPVLAWYRFYMVGLLRHV
jgi:hypothetical protein